MKSTSSSRQQRRQRLQPAQRPTGTPPTVAPAKPVVWASHHIPAWKPISLTAQMLAPLRLFLGVTFAYAGIQKLTDPQFFAPNAPGYVGRQLTAFAAGSPIRALLLNVVLPHAAFFGSLIAWGELAIGVGALLGLLLRPAAFFGMLLSLVFFRSASWRVHPYFYGSDIVFLFAWLTVLLAGPIAGGWLAVDTRLVAWLAARVPPQYDASLERAARIVLGVCPPHTDPTVTAGGHSKPTARARQSRYSAAATRRDFLRGAFTGVAATVGAALAVALFSKGGSSTAASGQSALPSPTAAGSGDVATATTAVGDTPIATANQFPANSAVSFTLPANGDPGVLIHLTNGDFVAFDASCTHAGCPVEYDPSSRLLLCPCHGAAFDPAQRAAVIQGPTDIPLTSVPIYIDHATGAITVSG